MTVVNQIENTCAKKKEKERKASNADFWKGCVEGGVFSSSLRQEKKKKNRAGMSRTKVAAACKKPPLRDPLTKMPRHRSRIGVDGKLILERTVKSINLQTRKLNEARQKLIDAGKQVPIR